MGTRALTLQLVVLVLPMMAYALVIDTFDQTVQSILVGPFGGWGESDRAPAPEAVGGHRKLGLSLEQVVQPGWAYFETGEGVLTLRGSYVGANASVVWDANGSGLGGLDLTDGGNSDVFPTTEWTHPEGRAPCPTHRLLRGNTDEETRSFLASPRGGSSLNPPLRFSLVDHLAHQV